MREFLDIKGDLIAGEGEISRSDLVCPFCGQTEFDKPGLKYHLENYCDEYRNTEEL